jgi:hypothetical protein
MAQDLASSSVEGGNQGPPMSTSNNPIMNVYMMKAEAHISDQGPRLRNVGICRKGKRSHKPTDSYPD